MANLMDQFKQKIGQAQKGVSDACGQVKSAWEDAGKQYNKDVKRKAQKPSPTARERSQRRRYGQPTSSFTDVGAPVHEMPQQPGLIERMGFERLLPDRESEDKDAGQFAKTRANRLHIDVPLVLVVSTLLIFGMLMVYSASADFSYEVHGSETYLFMRQLVFLGVGIVVATILTLLNYHIWQKLALYTMLGTLASLFIVLFIGDQRHGAVRTIFNGSVQPSELAKVITVIYLAVWLYSKRDVLHDVNFGLIPLGVILGLVGGSIYLQPDLSAVLTVFIIGGIMFFLANGDIKQIAIVLLLAFLVGSIVAISGGLNTTANERMGSFMAGWKDPLQASYHVQRSLEAFVKGGVFGVGIGKANTKLTGLPVPHTDSIFAVVGEETGFIGATALVILYTLLLWRGISIANRAPDGLGKLLAAGLSIWLALEAYINMAVMVGLMPFAGNALPFISVGGSNLVMSMVAIGIIMNVSWLSERTVEKKERTFSEVVDLRRRNGRRRVSGTRRSSRSQVSTSQR